MLDQLLISVKIAHGRIGHYGCRLLTVFAVAACVPSVLYAAPTLTADMDVATGGYYRLYWGSDETGSGEEFVLQESATSNFENSAIIYKGPDLATVISGKSDGKYFYRVRRARTDESQADIWSEAVNVNVEHHSLPKAVGFFIAGLIVFAATLFMIITGARKTAD